MRTGETDGPKAEAAPGDDGGREGAPEQIEEGAREAAYDTPYSEGSLGFVSKQFTRHRVAATRQATLADAEQSEAEKIDPARGGGTSKQASKQAGK